MATGARPWCAPHSLTEDTLARTGHGDKLASAAAKAADSKGFERAARVGYAASGLLHLLIGVIALQIASGGSGDADSSGAVAALAGQPGGLVLLWICFLGCLTLALFQLSRIWLEGGGLKGKDLWKMRGSAAGQAIAYGAIGTTFGSFALGGGTDSGESSTSWSARLMAQPCVAAMLEGIKELIRRAARAEDASAIQCALDRLKVQHDLQRLAWEKDYLALADCLEKLTTVLKEFFALERASQLPQMDLFQESILTLLPQAEQLLEDSRNLN